jgi:hypothetical protein
MVQEQFRREPLPKNLEVYLKEQELINQNPKGKKME